ncbi:hypothetical protein BJ166DRAFT_373398 [Pestalotiopsis sp. NC0098]|nr:hypothetical protein BJ166DRAFT_373398 [Pestalotiopsis sp. NC0098]
MNRNKLISFGATHGRESRESCEFSRVGGSNEAKRNGQVNVGVPTSNLHHLDSRGVAIKVSSPLALALASRIAGTANAAIKHTLLVSGCPRHRGGQSCVVCAQRATEYPMKVVCRSLTEDPDHPTESAARMTSTSLLSIPPVPSSLHTWYRGYRGTHPSFWRLETRCSDLASWMRSGHWQRRPCISSHLSFWDPGASGVEVIRVGCPGKSP